MFFGKGSSFDPYKAGWLKPRVDACVRVQLACLLLENLSIWNECL